MARRGRGPDSALERGQRGVGSGRHKRPVGADPDKSEAPLQMPRNDGGVVEQDPGRLAVGAAGRDDRLKRFEIDLATELARNPEVRKAYLGE